MNVRFRRLLTAVSMTIGVCLCAAGAAQAQYQAEPNPPILEPYAAGISQKKEFGATGAGPIIEWTHHNTSNGVHPDANEQRLLWLMNQARQNPAVEGHWLAEETDPDVAGGRNFFMVDTEQLKRDFDALPARPPAAFDVRLYHAMVEHSLDLISRDAQDHNGQVDRVNASGFSCAGGRFSVFSFAKSALNAHAGLNVDWGYGPGGMQDPPGHRYAIMDVDIAPLQGIRLTNVGLAMVAEHDPATVVGPWVFSGAYCHGGSSEFNRFLVGTVWDDLNQNNEYDIGEGIGGVSIMPDSGDYFAITGNSGGYAIPILSSGSYSVTFSGGGMASPVQKFMRVGEDSALLDLEMSNLSSDLQLSGSLISVAAGDTDGDGKGEFALAVLGDDAVPRIRCHDDDGSIVRTIVHAGTARHIDLASGDFDGDGRDDWALAMINGQGNLEIALYDADGTLIGSGDGGPGTSVSAKGGQLDTDAEDEYVVGLVQSDGRVAAISFNRDGSRVGKAVAGIGKLPEVAIGDFDAQAGDQEYIIAYLSGFDTLETSTYQGDGNFIGRGTGGRASDVTVAVGNLRADLTGEEYAVSLVQSDGTLGVISFTGEGVRTSKGVGGQTLGPRLATGVFEATTPLHGLVTALIQSDGKPIVIFFDAAGSRLGKGIAPEIGQAVDVATLDVDGDGDDEAVIGYLDADFKLEWGVFEDDGALIMHSR